MSVELKVPSVGESITEVQLGPWLKQPGETVNADEALVVIETDKVTVELPAPSAGTLTRTLKNQGDTAMVGEVIGYMEALGATAAQSKPAKANPADADAAAPAKSAQKKGAAAGSPPAEPATADSATKDAVAVDSATTDPVAAGSGARDAAAATSPATGPKKTRAEVTSQPGEPNVMPAAARELAQRGLSPSDVTPTGPGGRLLKEDVQRHAAALAASGSGASTSDPAPTDSATTTPPTANAPARAGASAPAVSNATPGAAPNAVSAAGAVAARGDAKATGPREEQVVPMTPMRKRIAERLVLAQHTAAILTTFNEIDMSNVMALRKQHQERFVERHKTKLGFMSFFVKAAIEALKQFPQVNAEVRGEGIVYKNYFDIGIAVGGGKGLVVPILRNAERLSFAEIELAIANLGKRAQENKLSLGELTGGTFTISNGGIYGSLLSTPILNPPQSGILGLHSIQERPIALGGQVVIRPMMYVALSYDHRIVDGREAVTFLKRIKECMEEPTRMLLEI